MRNSRFCAVYVFALEENREGVFAWSNNNVAMACVGNGISDVHVQCMIQYCSICKYFERTRAFIII